MSATSDTRAYRARKKAAGLCIYGGCWQPAEGGTATCSQHCQRRDPVCIEIGCEERTEVHRRLCAGHRKERARQVSIHSLRQGRARKRKQGLCLWHGCTVPVSKRAYCPEHRAAHAKATQDYYRRKREAGLCGYGACSAPASPGLSMCAEHAARNRAQWQRWWENRAQLDAVLLRETSEERRR
ncbi:MAG: hypothetical protein Q8R28_10715 [Dehalococcoidia bacterium]|nr:hypothetical protein [Dehalococcoidia bacterium]